MPGGGRVWHQSGMDDAERRRVHGEGSCRMPTTLEAGSTVAVEFAFAIGETEIPAGGKLRLAWRWPFDWAEPAAMIVRADGAEMASPSGNQLIP